MQWRAFESDTYTIGSARFFLWIASQADKHMLSAAECNSAHYYADHVWSPRGWINAAQFALDSEHGVALTANGDRSNSQYLGRFVLPGMPNLHSHAFQRAMAGLAERQTQAKDSFWTWREVMYRFASAINPAALKAIAAQLYVEMLKAGYTHVCEFHYLHHRPDGRPYADPTEMSLALVEAASEAGIGLTLLPTLYMQGGFDGRALNERQTRFHNPVDAYIKLVEQLRALENAVVKIGIALHSLRAVPPDALSTVVESPVAQRSPIHIHIAEQIGEVQDCLAYRDARPVEWLLDNAPVDQRWCLVHATHMNDDEIRRVANSGAVVGLCPTTEANLGDGLFALKAYIEANGVFGIGSDSHISVSPIEELRWLEYGQRLQSKHRNIAVSELIGSVAETLWGNTLFGGAQASGFRSGELTHSTSIRADLIVLDDRAPLLAARDTTTVLDTLVFAGNQNLVRDVMVAGRWVVRDFHHLDEQRIADRYRKTVESLMQA